MDLKNKDADYYSGDRHEVVALLPSVNSYKRVLEIGAGDGAFVSNLDQNVIYHILEPESIELLYPERVDQVYRGKFEEVLEQIPDNFYDLVICNDVIEHMSDHDLFFSRMKEKMSSNGRIVGSISNVRHVANLIAIVIKKDWYYVDSGFFDKTHLRFFTEKSLKRAFQQHNYTIERFELLNRVTCKNLFSAKCVIEKIISMLLGNDSKYIQFGFLIKK